MGLTHTRRLAAAALITLAACSTNNPTVRTSDTTPQPSTSTDTTSTTTTPAATTTTGPATTTTEPATTTRPATTTTTTTSPVVLPAACELVTQADAETATGTQLRPDPNASGRQGPNCTYLPADPTSLVLVTVGVTPATSQPPITETGATATPIAGLGDTATVIDEPTGGATITEQDGIRITVTVTAAETVGHNPQAEHAIIRTALGRL